jgi:hypothetical protein
LEADELAVGIITCKRSTGRLLEFDRLINTERRLAVFLICCGAGGGWFKKKRVPIDRARRRSEIDSRFTRTKFPFSAISQKLFPNPESA